MSGLSYDAVVVGGGPAGAAVARDIAQAGYTVAILERHAQVGQPVQCSGLVTQRTLAAAGLSTSFVHNALRGATIYAPSGASYPIGGNRIHAYVLDRGQFDAQLMHQARDQGAQLWPQTRAVGITRTHGQIAIHMTGPAGERAVRTRLVIGADGPRSLVADWLRLPAPAEVLHAYGADVRLPARPARDQVLLFTGRRYAPGFFAWVIPLGGDRYRIGWGTSRRSAGVGFRAVVADHPKLFAGMEIISRTGGLIPLGPRAVTSGAGGLVVGDAAGQAKATSGGGLYTALSCAADAATVAIDALGANDVSAARLAVYDRAWRGSLGVELARGLVLRQAYQQLSDREIDWGLRLLRLPGMRRLVDHFGDIDFPSHLATVALAAAPRLTRLLHGQVAELTAFGRTDFPDRGEVGDGEALSTG